MKRTGPALDVNPRAAIVARKLRQWLRDQKAARQEGIYTGKPWSMRGIAAFLTEYLREHGDHDPSCEAATVDGWMKGKNLPLSHLVPGIEVLVEASWSYLCDAEQKWPPSPENQELFRLVFSDRAERERVRARAEIRDALARLKKPAR